MNIFGDKYKFKEQSFICQILCHFFCKIYVCVYNDTVREKKNYSQPYFYTLYICIMFFEFHKPIPLWKKILHAKLHLLWLIGLKMLVVKAFIVKLLAVKAVFAAEAIMAVGAGMAPLFSFASTPTVVQALPEHPAAAEQNTVYDTIADQNKGIIIDSTIKENNKDIIAQPDTAQPTENSDTQKNANVTAKWNAPKTPSQEKNTPKPTAPTSTAYGLTTLRGYSNEEWYGLHPELRPSVFAQIQNSL